MPKIRTVYKKDDQDKPEVLVGVNPMKTTVREYFGPYQKAVTGLKFGIEIEVEDANDRYPSETKVAATGVWNSVPDNSLRDSTGHDRGGREFVFSKPLTFAQSITALTEADKFFKTARCSVKDSPRTSVHVHVNVQDLTLTQLTNLLCLYYVAEPLLSRFNGAKREHNLFALQLQHAPGIIGEIIECFQRRSPSKDLKYTALNVMPLFSRTNPRAFGTVEFRAGAAIKEKPTDTVEWLKIIRELYESALNNFKVPSILIDELSSLGVEEFLVTYLPRLHGKTNNLFSPMEIEATVMNSMRAVQELAYRLDWADIEPAEALELAEKPYNPSAGIVRDARTPRRGVPAGHYRLRRAGAPVRIREEDEERNRAAQEHIAAIFDEIELPRED